ncbi:MAG: CARDB domain-containing protein [Phycisphaerae bacterium]
MNSPRRIYGWLEALIVLIVAALPTSFAHAYSFYTYGADVVVWPGSQCFRYLSPTTFPPDSQSELAAIGTMVEWSVVPGCTFAYGYETSDQDYAIDNFDGFSDTAAVPTDQLDPGVLGVTFLVNDGPSWFDTDIVISDFPSGVGYNFDFYPNCDSITQPVTGNYGYNFVLIVLHELGHALGLGHDPFGDEQPGILHFPATMNPRYPSGGTLGQQHIIELHTDDRSGVRFLYPNSGPSGTPFPDLALSEYASGPNVGQAVPLQISPSVAIPGDEVILRSVIENLGSTNEFFVNQSFYLSNDDVITTDDLDLGTLAWDIAFEDALDFEVAVDIPDDIAAGNYTLGAIIDADNFVDEIYEDNNAVAYCEPFSIAQLAPGYQATDIIVEACDQPLNLPAPALTHPINMAPVTWSLDNPQPGMSIHPATGELSWPNPVPSPFLYGLQVRGTNGGGSTVETIFLGIESTPPAIVPVDDQVVTCLFDFFGSPPQLTSPACMEPVLFWTFDEAPPGMTIDPDTGSVTWISPVPSATPYRVVQRVVTANGSATVTWDLLVQPGDFNGDGATTVQDMFTALICLQGPAIPAGGFCNCVDLGTDGTVDLADMARFFNEFE